MNIVLLTLTLFLMSLGGLFSLDRLFHRLDTGFYRSFQPKQRVLFMITIWSFMYTLYVLSFGEVYLPLVIIGFILSFTWLFMFFHDTSLKLVEWQDKILLVSITLIALIVIYFGFKYILLLAITKPLQRHLNENLRKSNEMLLAESFVKPEECKRRISKGKEI